MTEHNSGASIFVAQDKAEERKKRFEELFKDELEILRGDTLQDIAKLRFLISDYDSRKLDFLVDELIREGCKNYDALGVLFEYGANPTNALKLADELYPGEEGVIGRKISGDWDYAYSDEYRAIKEVVDTTSKLAKEPQQFLNHNISEEELIDLIEGTSSKHLDARINGETLLTFAAKAKYFDAVDLLLERGANLKVLDLNGNSALDYLDIEAAKIDRSEPDGADLSFMTLPVVHKVDQTIDKFEEYLARNSFPDASAIDNNVTKVAQLMAKNKVKDIPNFRKLLEEVKQDDLTELAKYFVQNDYSNTEALRLMFDYGADQKQVKDIVNKIDPKGVLWNSQKRNAYEGLFTDITTRPKFPEEFKFKGEKEFIEFVRKTSAKDIDEQDKNGDTLLTYAAKNEFYNVIKNILEKGANPNLVDSSGKTAYDYLSAAVDDELGQNQSRFGLLQSDKAQKAFELIDDFGGEPSSALQNTRPAQKDLDNEEVTRKPKETSAAAPNKHPELFIDENGQITQLKREVVNKNLIHHNHPDTNKTLIKESGNNTKGYRFDPINEFLEPGQEIVIEIPCMGKDGKMLQDKKEKLIFDPFTKEIIEYSIPEGFKSRIDPQWFAKLEEKPGLSHAAVATRDTTQKPLAQKEAPETVRPHMEQSQREVYIYQIMEGGQLIEVKDGKSFVEDKFNIDKEKGTVDIKGKNGAAVAGNYLIEFSSSQNSNRKDILIFEKGVLKRAEFSAGIYRGNVSRVGKLTDEDRELKPVSLPVIPSLHGHSSLVKGEPSHSALPNKKKGFFSGLIK